MKSKIQIKVYKYKLDKMLYYIKYNQSSTNSATNLGLDLIDPKTISLS